MNGPALFYHYQKLPANGGGVPQERIARFWASVEPGPNGCWIWQRGRYSHRGKLTYGQTMLAGRRTGAHRVAWTLTHGPIPNGLDVLHSCDNPPCVNPAHLRVGTHRGNIREARSKHDWTLRGEAHPRVRLSDAAVEVIRSSFAGGISARWIGRRAAK